MASTDLVRASRDGDQFHYLWAARQCLKLLPGTENLVAITIEGASEREAGRDRVTAGEEIIDVGFYYGSESREEAERIRYVQLKHSTVASNDPWTASGLKKTIKGFAERYVELLNRFTVEDVAERFIFEFTTNRPIDNKVQEALADLRSSAAISRHAQQQKTLLRYSGLKDAQASRFFMLFRAVGSERGLWDQQNLLSQDLSAYLVDADYDSPIQLKDLITRKATTEFESNPSIRRHDILRALKASEELLLPAPCLIPAPEDCIPREQENEIKLALLNTKAPLIIHADGGVGKSVIAACITASVPLGSEAVLYDCFGDGLYRSSLNFRHRHEDGLVQIANELAARGLCHPLIPTVHADPKQYMRAFQHRINQAIGLLRAKNKNAYLCLIIDAADNAEMAAEEQGEPASFIRDLIRSNYPEGVRLAFTCRTHRISKLFAPIDAQLIELRTFSVDESALHLRRVYLDASNTEAEEFRFLSSSNPRVQALALEQKLPLQEMLRRLGPEPTTVERAIGNLLERAIARLKDDAGIIEAAHIDMMCKGLAILRPLVPVSVLAKLSQTSESAIRSFVLDFGRPLLLKGNSLHFLDEPTETWFRERFKPSQTELIDFVERLRPLASQSSYVASALPPLLLQAGKLDELISLALSGEGLPNENPLEKRDVELQRLTFSIKASLQQKQYAAAAKLALKAGGESAGEERQNAMIQENTDLAAHLLAPDRIEEIISRRIFNSGWMGSHHAYDAGLLSGREEFSPDASSRLRMAMDWLYSWARSMPDEHNREHVSDADRVELAAVILRVRGAKAAAQFLRRWRTRNLAFNAGRGLGERLVDLGEYDLLDALIDASGNDVWLLLGLVTEANIVSHKIPAAPLKRLLRLLGDRRVKLSESSGLGQEWSILDAVRSAVELALRILPKEFEQWASVVQRYLPPEPPSAFTSQFEGERVALLKAYVLASCLQGQALDLDDIAPIKTKEQLQSKNHHEFNQDVKVFQREVGGLLPWINLTYEVACGRPPQDLAKSIEDALNRTKSAYSSVYNGDKSIYQTVVLEWLKIILDTQDEANLLLKEFKGWLDKNKSDMWPKTLTSMCRLAARTSGRESLAIDFSVNTYECLSHSREHAESRAESYVELARAIFPVSLDESSCHFNHAIEIASRIGEENLDRWSAFLHLATAAGEQDTPRPQTAYRLSRIAELTYEYVARDKHFDWNRTVESMTELCASSALAILSRWRDRRFGDSGRLLPLVIYQICAQGRLPAHAPVALSGIDAQWSRLQDLKCVVAESDPTHSQIAAQIAYRYIRVSSPSVIELQEIRKLGKETGISFADIERLIHAECEYASKKSNCEERFVSTSPQEKQKPDWNELFRDVNFSCSDALRTTYESGRSDGSFFGLDSFFREAFERVSVGKESQLVRAICNWPDFDIFTLRHLLDAVSLHPPRQMSFKAAIKNAVLEACRRTPENVTRRGWGALIPFEKLNEAGLVSDKDVVLATLEGFESQTKSLNASGFFKLLDPLAATLSSDEAEEVLNFGFDLLEELLKPEDGDGPWQVELMPPTSLNSSVAGYIWSGLGSPVASERWEYAHVVRAVVELGWTEIIDELIGWANSETALPFTDSTLDFYLWHARQWLLIGLARGGLDNPVALKTATQFLQQMASVDHVVIRDFAAQALLVSGELSDGCLSRLNNVNQSTLAEQVYSGWYKADTNEEPEYEKTLSDDEKYYFGIDVGPYWLNPLGRAFGITQSVVEARARGVLRQELGWTGNSGYKEDVRYQKKIFYDRETSHSHGSMPKTDDLTTYHSYHAMMIVAAGLLVERPVLRNSDEESNEFQQWFEGYQLSRTDKKWMFDRRDPLTDKKWFAPKNDERQSWRWAITSEYLHHKLVSDDCCFTLWGDWTNYDNGFSESTIIRSALVSRTGAMSLAAALQTSSELDPYALPSACRQDELLLSELSLRGWVVDENIGTGLDEFDPWAINLSYPGPMPSGNICSCCDLTPSTNGRVWRAVKNGFIRSEVWIEPQGYGREKESVPGKKLCGNSAFITELLDKHPSDCLIISVAVRRFAPKYIEKEEDYLSYAQPYVRIYLMERDGVARSI